MGIFQDIALVIAAICVGITVIETGYKITFKDKSTHIRQSIKLNTVSSVAMLGLMTVYLADKIAISKLNIFAFTSNIFILLGFLLIVANYVFSKRIYEQEGMERQY